MADDVSGSTLVVIDLQNEFFSEGGHFSITSSSKDALLSNLRTLVPKFRAAKGKLVWVRSIYGTETHQNHSSSSTSSPGSASHPRLSGTHSGRTPCCVAGSVNAEFYPDIAALISPSEDTIATKAWYSAFKETSLLDDLRLLQTKNVYFCGLLSNTCVLATILDAVCFEELETVHVVSDCLGWKYDPSHQKALEKMVALGVKITESAAVLGLGNTENSPALPKLYYVNGSIPSWRVQIALYEKGIEVESIRMKVMTRPKPTRLPSFLALNPRGKTPVLIDVDDSRTVINESLAILNYLEDYYPKHGRSLLPPLYERSSRARVLSLIQESENLHNAYDALEDAFFHARDTSTQTDFATSIRPRLLQSLDHELQFWERYASNSPGKFIAATAELTLADCAFYPIIGYMLRTGFTFDPKWPGLKRYHETVWNMPSQSARKAQPEGWKGMGKTDVFQD